MTVVMPFQVKNALKVHFRNYMPQRMYVEVISGGSQQEKNRAFHLDQIDYHYRQYLAGYRRTLRRVLWEIRRPREQMKTPDAARYLILDSIRPAVLDPIERLAKQYDLQEISARHMAAIKKIEKVISHEKKI